MQRSISGQVVTGQHTYSTVVCYGIADLIDGSGSVTINDVDSSTIALKDRSVTFTSKKTFNQLIVLGHLNTALVNNVSTVQ